MEGGGAKAGDWVVFVGGRGGCLGACCADPFCVGCVLCGGVDMRVRARSRAASMLVPPLMRFCRVVCCLWQNLINNEKKMLA